LVSTDPPGLPSLLPMTSLFRRVVVSFWLIVLLLAAGLLLALTRPSCAGSATCAVRVVAVGAGLAAVAVLPVAWVIVERARRPLREVTRVARRVAGGDDSARVLTGRDDEIGDL